MFAALAILFALLTLAGLAYYIISIFSARSFLHDAALRQRTSYTPPVSFLKPLKGIDPGIYEAFRSHCLQDYPEFEIVFGVSDPNDAAIPLVQQLQREFPSVAIKLVIAERALGANGKVSTLAQMLPHARYDHLIVNDSDITITTDYLSRVMSPFADSKVGMVTCLYRGIAANTLGSKLESLGIATDFIPGVLTARTLQGVKFGLGSTLAFRRSSLQRIGGFESLVDHLADDYELGARIAALGEKVIVSEMIVGHHLPAYTFGDFFDHQLRWARAVRDSRRAGYLGLAITHALPWALLAVLFAKAAPWSLALLLVTFLVRLTMAITVGHHVLRDPQLARHLWLLPLRDVLGLVLWFASFAGHTIVWRGDRFTLKDGKLHPAKS
ncbi:MAG TPA: bacteriohopanetetrol glucosamine biosynthesis glycosyltransferase HpnI [Terriglobales bacterium]|nr:bacteriohopanetetrol glucosamine biosynthesis glycosyltransferase HpnI [Terriglobales bacterium]